METRLPREVNPSLQRLQALTDGVLTIVLTLLDFNINLPKYIVPISHHWWMRRIGLSEK